MRWCLVRKVRHTVTARAERCIDADKLVEFTELFIDILLRINMWKFTGDNFRKLCFESTENLGCSRVVEWASLFLQWSRHWNSNILGRRTSSRWEMRISRSKTDLASSPGVIVNCIRSRQRHCLSSSEYVDHCVSIDKEILGPWTYLPVRSKSYNAPNISVARSEWASRETASCGTVLSLQGQLVVSDGSSHSNSHAN